MNRRTFIEKSMALSLLMSHDYGFCLDNGSETMLDVPLINYLELLTSTPLKEMALFYKVQLGLPIVSLNEKELQIRAGSTVVKFIKIENSTNPFYHFAFNIPENKIVKALEWQQKRTSIFPAPQHMIDSNYPKSIRHFRNWNAHSVFFLDPAGNLLEYIARHDLSNSAVGDFSSKDILYASEIALIVDDVNKTKTHIKTTLEMNEYKGGSDQFSALGNEKGLILLMKKGRPWMSHTETPMMPKNHKTRVDLNLGISASLRSDKHPYEISSVD